MYAKLGTQLSTQTEPSIALVWKNVSCDGKGSLRTRCMRSICFTSYMPKKVDKLLTNVSGNLMFGELTALMGPSGAGKSTLLKCLTEGKNNFGVEGRIAVTTDDQVRACLITQNDKDHLLLNLTVSEALYYASEIKNPASTNREQHNQIVDGLLDELDLVKTKKTIIDKCSGGQKKRIAIALELTAMKKPNFLFLDEPTSGLDSHSGFNIVFRLRALAMRRHMAVVIVIHQPSSEIFNQFHNAYILSKVGKCVFYGSPMQLQQQLVDYEYITSGSPIMNPADIIITIASSVSKDDNKTGTDANTDVEATTGLCGTVKTIQSMKIDCNHMTEKLEEMWLMSPTAHLGREIQNQGLCSYSASFRFYALWILLKRACVTSLWRQKQLIFIRLALHTVVVAVLTALYNRELGTDDGCTPVNIELHDRNSSCSTSEDSNASQNIKFQFFSLLFLMFAAMMPTVLTFSAEIKLFINEHRNGWYSTSCSYISKTLVEIPLQILFPFCYVYFLYWYSQQPGMDDWYGGLFGFMSWRYAYFLSITILSCFVAQGLGFLIGITCVNSFSMAIIVSSSLLLFLFLFSGFFVMTSQMSAFSQFITYFSFIRFSFESILVILYGHDRCTMLPETQILRKSVILSRFDLGDKVLVSNCCWLVCHLVVSRILAFILLKKLADPKFMQMSSFKCSFLLNRILPRCLEARVKTSKLMFFAVRIFLIIFLIHVVFGIVILIYNRF